MSNLEQELSDYVDRREGTWAATTLHTAYFKLRTCLYLGLEPDSLYARLETTGHAPYTIKTYFILARDFEEETKGTQKIRHWMRSHRLRFKNCYKKKSYKVTDIEFQSYLNRASSRPSLYNFLMLTGRAGLRKSEALDVKWSDINNGCLEVVAGKGGKQRFIPFNRAWLKNPEGKTTGLILPVTFNAQYLLFKIKSNASPHDFRSYFAEKIVNSPGMTVEDARDLLGHTDIRSTAQYLRANQERQHKAVMEMFNQ